jgi:hypothetical protein
LPEALIKKRRWTNSSASLMGLAGADTFGRAYVMVLSKFYEKQGNNMRTQRNSLCSQKEYSIIGN